jgi:hypothetical protein
VGTKASKATKHQVLAELDTVEETVDDTEVALYYDAPVSHHGAPVAFHADDYNNIWPCDNGIVRAAAVTEAVPSSCEESIQACAGSHQGWETELRVGGPSGSKHGSQWPRTHR